MRSKLFVLKKVTSRRGISAPPYVDSLGQALVPGFEDYPGSRCSRASSIIIVYHHCIISLCLTLPVNWSSRHWEWAICQYTIESTSAAPTPLSTCFSADLVDTGYHSLCIKIRNITFALIAVFPPFTAALCHCIFLDFWSLSGLANTSNVVPGQHPKLLSIQLSTDDYPRFILNRCRALRSSLLQTKVCKNCSVLCDPSLSQNE